MEVFSSDFFLNRRKTFIVYVRFILDDSYNSSSLAPCHIQCNLNHFPISTTFFLRLCIRK